LHNEGTGSQRFGFALAPALFSESKIMGLIGVDFSALDADVREEMKKIFQRDHEIAMVQALARQAEIGRFYAENQPVWSDGIGPQTMAIDPVLMNAFRMKLGDEAHETEALEWLAGKVEGIKVKAVSPKTQVGYASSGECRVASGKSEEGGRVKFRKVYA
jgi:hypothetical protein